jgi:RNA polymerase sigma-70 factor (ECF subfamily)
LKDLTENQQIQIIEEFKENPEVFEKIYNHYYEYILRYLTKRSLDSEAAYEITAETFIKAFENFSKFKYKGVSIKSWLFKIAINQFNSHHRKKEPTLMTEEMYNDKQLVKDTKEELKALDKAMFGDEKLMALSKAIAALKPTQQSVISLYYFSEMSQAEIAVTIKKSVGAVKSIMHRATKNLKHILPSNLTEL